MKLKKLLSMVMATAMLAGMMCVSASAATYGTVTFSNMTVDAGYIQTETLKIPEDLESGPVETEAQVLHVQPGSGYTIAGDEAEFGALALTKDEDDEEAYRWLDAYYVELTTGSWDEEFDKEVWDYPTDLIYLSYYPDRTSDEHEVLYVMIDREDDGNKMPTAFQDVAADDYFVKPVKWAVRREITAGTSETTFSPYAVCTEAQIITFLWKAEGGPEVEGENPYSTVSESDYYYKAVVWAVSRGILDDSFSPNEPCTRATAVTYIYNNVGKPQEEIGDKFTDVVGQPYESAVYFALRRGVTSGTSETTFSPDEVCTRAQIMTFLYKQYNP